MAHALRRGVTVWVVVGAVQLWAQPRPEAEVEQAVRAWSEALAHGDSAGLRAVASPQLVLQEDGVEQTLEQAIAAVQAALTAGTLSRTLSGLAVHVNGSTAWCRAQVDGAFQMDGGVLAFHRLELVVLERVRGRWKVVAVSSQVRPQG